MNQRHVYDALTAMSRVAVDPAVALTAVKYFFSKYPEEALESLNVPKPNLTTINIPAIAAGVEGWPYGRAAATYNLTAEQMAGLWGRLPDKKVEAIKYIRGEIGIPLKEAKDLIVFVIEENIHP